MKIKDANIVDNFIIISTDIGQYQLYAQNAVMLGAVLVHKVLGTDKDLRVSFNKFFLDNNWYSFYSALNNKAAVGATHIMFREALNSYYTLNHTRSLECSVRVFLSFKKHNIWYLKQFFDEYGNVVPASGGQIYLV